VEVFDISEDSSEHDLNRLGAEILADSAISSLVRPDATSLRISSLAALDRRARAPLSQNVRRRFRARFVADALRPA